VERASLLHAAIRPHEPNPTAWYLLGFDRLRRGIVKDAARAFGMAHHQDADLESAALLTFACLKARPNVACDVLDQIAITWRELGRPVLAGHRRDRNLIELLERQEGDVPVHLSQLGRVAWLAAGEECRDRFRAHSRASSDVWADFFR